MILGHLFARLAVVLVIMLLLSATRGENLLGRALTTWGGAPHDVAVRSDAFDAASPSGQCAHFIHCAVSGSSQFDLFTAGQVLLKDVGVSSLQTGMQSVMPSLILSANLTLPPLAI